MKKEENVSDNNFGLASGILGIISVVLSLSGVNLSVGAVILGIIGIIFSSKQNKIKKNRWSKNGKILSIVGIILGILFFILAFSQIVSTLPQYAN